MVRCTRPLAFSVHASRRSWKSRWFANTRPGSKFERMNRCERSSAPLACGSRASRITQPTSSCPQNDANGSVGRPPAAIAASRSHTSFSGNAPSRVRLRARPHRMSGASLLKISVPAIARDQHTSHGHHPATAPLPVPDRDLLGRLPQIALHQLPRPIDRPLKRPRRQEPRPDLADIVIKDRLAARIAQARRPSPATAATGSADPPRAARRSSP